MNVVGFNITSVESLVGPKLDTFPYYRLEQKLMLSESSKQCAYCAMFGK